MMKFEPSVDLLVDSRGGRSRPRKSDAGGRGVRGWLSASELLTGDTRVLLLPRRGQGELTGAFKEFIHGCLQFGRVNLALAEPVGEGAEGGLGQEFGYGRDGERRARGVGAAEADSVVAQRGPQILAQAGDKEVNKGREIVPTRFGEAGLRAPSLKIIGEVVVRYGSVTGIGQLLADCQRAALLSDGLGNVTLVVEQDGERAERYGGSCWIFREDLEADLQLSSRLGEPA